MLLVINLTGLLNFGHRLNTQGLLVADKPHNYSRPLVGTWSSTAGELVALTSIVTCAEPMMLIVTSCSSWTKSMSTLIKWGC